MVVPFLFMQNCVGATGVQGGLRKNSSQNPTEAMVPRCGPRRDVKSGEVDMGPPEPEKESNKAGGEQVQGLLRN